MGAYATARYGLSHTPLDARRDYPRGRGQNRFSIVDTDTPRKRLVRSHASAGDVPCSTSLLL